MRFLGGVNLVWRPRAVVAFEIVSVVQYMGSTAVFDAGIGHQPLARFVTRNGCLTFV